MPLTQSPSPKLSSPPGVVHPQVTRQILSNGLTLLVQEDHAHPLVAFTATVRTGSATEGDFLGKGISHVVEHMLFKGTARRPVGAVEKEARSYGGTTQGFTTFDTTSYQLVVNKEFWSPAADLLVDALFFPSLDAEEFLKERQVVLRELKLGQDDPSHQAYELLFENAYRIHPYHVPIIGYEPLLLGITRKEVVDYHRRWYLPNAMVISVVGDVETDAVIHRMEELTSKIQPGVVPSRVLPQEPLPVAPREVSREIPAALAVAAIGFPSVSAGDPDLFALDLLAWVLGGGRGSRLEKTLKEPGIVYEVNSWNYTPHDRGLFVITARMEPDQMPKALEFAFEEAARSQGELISSSELEAAKRAFLRGYLASRQTVTGQASDLAINETLVGDPQFAQRYVEEIQKITPEELERVARIYLRPERATVITIFPEGKRPPVGKGHEAIPSAPPVSKEILKNGLTVLLREDHRLPLVTLQVSMLGGVRYETERINGISMLTARLLLRGTSQKDSRQIIEALKKMGAELAPSSGRNSLGLTVEVVRTASAEAVELLSELIQQPTFPEEELQKEKRILLAELRAQEEDPIPWGVKRLMTTLFTSHPYRLNPFGTPESISHLTQKDVETFYRTIRQPQQMVLTIVGDFETNRMREIVTRTLSRLEHEEVHPLVIPPEPPLQTAREHQEITSRKEGLLMIGFQGLRFTDPRLPYADLLEEVLSSGAGRLFSEVRERRGLAYAVGAFQFQGIDPGAVILYAVSDPANLGTVRDAVLEEVRRLRSVPLPEKELARAKQGLLGSRRIARQAQAALAAQMSLDELYGLGYDFTSKYEARVQSATPEEIFHIAQEILDPQRSVIVTGRSTTEAGESSVKQPSEKQDLSVVESPLPIR